jgi:ketosteroid isomerase-like protein
MLALRYTVTLPRDYDMNRVRERIAARGGEFDSTEGLLFKAFCLSEAGVGDGAENSYSPFYVWTNTSRMGAFLWDHEGFGSFVKQFGRPRMETWAISSIQLNKAGMRGATAAQITSTADNGAALDQVAERQKSDAIASHKQKGNVGAVRGVNLATGEAMAFDAYTAVPRTVAGRVYEVAHVSVPGTDT